MNKKYLVTSNKSMLFLVTDNWDYYVFPKENEKWNEVDTEETPYPSESDIEIPEEEALKIALSYGMSKEEFYKI